MTLLFSSLAGCGGGGSSDAPAAAQATPIPEELRGQWETILTYVPGFYGGPYGGAPQGDGSLGITFTFGADGRYQHVWQLIQAYFGGNCFRNGHWDESGTLSGTGPEFTFTPGHASFIGSDSCGKFQHIDPVPVTAASHGMVLDHDNTGWPLLRISFPTGDIVFEKCRRCQ